MTLLRTDGDGYLVISDIGKRYGLYEMNTVGTPTPQTRDCVAIMYENEDPAEEEVIGFFYGVDTIKDKDTLKFIRGKIDEFECKKFKDDAILYSETAQTF